MDNSAVFSSSYIYVCMFINLLLQVHTPDSSRYWIAASYEQRQGQGLEPENIDKVLDLWTNF